MSSSQLTLNIDKFSSEGIFELISQKNSSMIKIFNESSMNRGDEIKTFLIENLIKFPENCLIIQITNCDDLLSGNLNVEAFYGPEVILVGDKFVYCKNNEIEIKKNLNDENLKTNKFQTDQKNPQNNQENPINSKNKVTFQDLHENQSTTQEDPLPILRGSPQDRTSLKILRMSLRSSMRKKPDQRISNLYNLSGIDENFPQKHLEILSELRRESLINMRQNLTLEKFNYKLLSVEEFFADFLKFDEIKESERKIRFEIFYSIIFDELNTKIQEIIESKINQEILSKEFSEFLTTKLNFYSQVFTILENVNLTRFLVLNFFYHLKVNNCHKIFEFICKSLKIEDLNLPKIKSFITIWNFKIENFNFDEAKKILFTILKGDSKIDGKIKIPTLKKAVKSLNREDLFDFLKMLTSNFRSESKTSQYLKPQQNASMLYRIMRRNIKNPKDFQIYHIKFDGDENFPQIAKFVMKSRENFPQRISIEDLWLNSENFQNVVAKIISAKEKQEFKMFFTSEDQLEKIIKSFVLSRDENHQHQFFLVLDLVKTIFPSYKSELDKIYQKIIKSLNLTDSIFFLNI